jgi:hypothetical protein
MMLLALALAAAPAHPPKRKPNVFDQFDRQTLVITDGGNVTRLDYPDQASCERARDAVLRQWNEQHPNVLVAGQSAVCVPR